LKALKWLDNNLEKVIIGVLLTLMTIVMGIQVVARYALNSSLTWSEELTRYLFVWSGFISLPFTIKAGITLRIDQFYKMLPKGIRNILNIINHVLMTIFFAFMAYNAAGVVQSSIASGQRSPALGIPMYLIQVSSVVGFSLAVIRTLQQLFVVIKNNKGGEELCH
jgi:TRAP-type C4-dicarboxylate transport system permease small subunit